MPKDPTARAAVFAAHLPADAESLVVIAEVKTFREKVKTLKKNLGDSAMVDQVQKQFQKAFGIDLLDEKSWVDAGLTPNSSLGLAIYRDRPIIYMYVDNRQKFEQTIIRRMESTFQFKGAAKTSKVGDYTVKYISDDPTKQMSWLYNEKLVMLTMPSLSTTGALEAGGASLVLTDARSVKPDASYKSLKMFTKFTDRFVKKYPVAGIVPVENYLKNPDVQKRIGEQPNGKQAEAMIRKYAKHFIFAADIKAERLSAEVYVAGSDQLNSTVQMLSKLEPEAQLQNLVTENTGLGVRLSIDPMAAFGFATTVMPEGEVRRFKRRLKSLGDQLGIDVEKDVLAALNGHVGIFFYGIAGNALELAGGDPQTIANKLGLMASLSFKDQKGLDNLVNKLVKKPIEGVTGDDAIADGNTPLPWSVDEVKSESGVLLEGMRSVKPPLPLPVRILTYKDRLVIAAPALGEQTVYDYLTGKRSKDKKIGDVEGFDLGNDFATTKAFNGLYANVKRLKTNPGQILSMIGAGFLIDNFDEMSLKIDPDEIGLKVSLTADMKKSEKAAPSK